MEAFAASESGWPFLLIPGSRILRPSRPFSASPIAQEPRSLDVQTTTQSLEIKPYYRPNAFFCAAPGSIADGMAVGGRLRSHFTLRLEAADVLFYEKGRSIRLGSVLSSPLTAATPLRSASRTSQVWALTVAILKVGFAA